jgi:hypothetical protein
MRSILNAQPGPRDLKQFASSIVRQESLPMLVRTIAWKAQLRLCARYRRLMAAGKRQTVVTTAIAREMAAFLWAIGHAVEPRPAA